MSRVVNRSFSIPVFSAKAIHISGTSTPSKSRQASIVSVPSKVVEKA
jgi:hypothetical protein